MKQVTSFERGLRATLVDIAARNAALHIYTAVDQAGALAAARASDARLATGKPLSAIDGVIVSVKDNIDVAGLPTTAGLGFRRAAIAARDAFVVARLRAAGAVILGKVNMHAAAFGATNHNADFGDCELNEGGVRAVIGSRSDRQPSASDCGHRHGGAIAEAGGALLGRRARQRCGRCEDRSHHSHSAGA